MNENIGAIIDKIHATAATAGEMASRAIGGAGKKASGAYSMSKLKLKIFNVKTDMDILYKELGRLVYAEHCDEETSKERLHGILLALDDKREELKALNDACEELKGTKYCASCGEANPRDNAFCSSCGYEF